MQISLLIYNLLYSSAQNHIKNLLKTYDPDIVCLQEVDLSPKNLKKIEIDGYTLAGTSKSFQKKGTHFGIATYFQQQRLRFNESSLFVLPRSRVETTMFILKGVENQRTGLRTEFITADGTPITVYNMHLSPFATNQIRVQQLKKTLGDFDFSSVNKVILGGDFNYPYGRKNFEKLIEKYGLQEATNNLLYTMQRKLLGVIPIRLKLDYVLYKGLECINTERVDVRISDHFPIFVKFKI